MNCRNCKKNLEHCFIDLGSAPPSNSYLTKTQLNLTDEQTDQFKPIFLDYLKKRMDTMNKHGINRESRSNAQNIDIRQLRKFKKDMDKINKAVIDDLEEFMNKDQIAKFKEMLEVQRNEMREKLLQRYQDRNS